MARQNRARGYAEQKFRGSTRRGWALAGLLAVVACGGAGLSGCAGLASTSNASPTPQKKVRRDSAANGVSQLSLSSTSLNFGSVLVNGRSTQAVTIQNSSQGDVQISQIGVAGAGFSVSGVATPVTVPAGQSMAVQTTFAPTTAGAGTGAITVTSNAVNSTSNVTLSGNGVGATYTMSLSPASVSFGNVNAGSSATQNVQLSNTGNTSVTVTQVTASGSGNGSTIPSAPCRKANRA